MGQDERAICTFPNGTRPPGSKILMAMCSPFRNMPGRLEFHACASRASSVTKSPPTRVKSNISRENLKVGEIREEFLKSLS
jgi:hypothetical protein